MGRQILKTTLADPPIGRQILHFAICGSSASLKFLILPFAEAPQASNFLFHHLRKLRKHQFFCFAICGSSASTKFSVLLFAEAPQAPNFLFCHLRKLRKHQISCFAICGSSASVKFYFFTFAQAEQAFIRNKQTNARKHFAHLRDKHRK